MTKIYCTVCGAEGQLGLGSAFLPCGHTEKLYLPLTERTDSRDKRSAVEKKLWDIVGPPLYYCADCLRSVKVTAVDGGEPVVSRPCGPECGEQIIAPRKAIMPGEGGLNLTDRAKQTYSQMAASLTGRCV